MPQLQLPCLYSPCTMLLIWVCPLLTLCRAQPGGALHQLYTMLLIWVAPCSPCAEPSLEELLRAHYLPMVGGLGPIIPMATY